MAFASVAGSAESVEQPAATSHTVDLPASISSGDLLIGFFSVNADPGAIVWPMGWSEILQLDDGQVSLSVAYRDADGGEGASIEVTTTNSEKSAHQMYRITGAEDPATQAPEIDAGTTGASTTPDPGSLTPTGGAEDFLWFAVTANDGRKTVTAFPTNYTDGVGNVNDNDGGVALGVARRELNASSEDPGTFTISGSDQWAAATVAVHPAAAAGVKPIATIFTIAEGIEINPNRDFVVRM